MANAAKQFSKMAEYACLLLDLESTEQRAEFKSFGRSFKNLMVKSDKNLSGTGTSPGSELIEIERLELDFNIQKIYKVHPAKNLHRVKHYNLERL